MGIKRWHLDSQALFSIYIISGKSNDRDYYGGPILRWKHNTNKKKWFIATDTA